jgi:hypothetical protein
MRDTPTRPSRKIRARESSISQFRGKKQEFDFQIFVFNIFSLRKARAALKRIIVFRSDAQCQVSIHGHQDSQQRAKSNHRSRKTRSTSRKLAPREAQPLIQTFLHQINTLELSFWHQQFEHKINRTILDAACYTVVWGSHITHLGTGWRVRRQIRVKHNTNQELIHSQLPQPSPAQPITLQCQQTIQRQRADHLRALIRDEKPKKQKLRFCNSTAVEEQTTSESHTTRAHDGEDVTDNRIATA